MRFLSALSKVLPIFLLVLLGVALRRIRLIRPETIDEVKMLMVNALPHPQSPAQFWRPFACWAA